MANSCLENLEEFEERRSKNLVGAKIRDSINSSSSLEIFGKKKDVGQVCIIGRTNISLFQAVVDIIARNKKDPLKIFIVGVILIIYLLNNDNELFYFYVFRLQSL